jgi:hypothetical protein
MVLFGKMEFKMHSQEVIMKELNMEILPEAAKRELFGFYEYLVDKYAKKKVTEQPRVEESDKMLIALQQFKRLRKRLHHVIDPLWGYHNSLSAGTPD